MLRNVEIKARIESVEALKPVAAGIADEGPVEIFQDDTFFRCPSGRLKLRAFSNDSGELIFYRRADERGRRNLFISYRRQRRRPRVAVSLLKPTR